MINPDELILISVDDHICEPRDMFDAHVPAKYRDQAPRVVEEDDGVEQWWYGNLRGRNIGLNAAANAIGLERSRCSPVSWNARPSAAARWRCLKNLRTAHRGLRSLSEPERRTRR